jgi:hypothetical protein
MVTPMGLPTARTFRTLALSLAAFFMSSAAFAGWQEDAAPAEIDRLNHLPQIRDAAIADAKSGQGQGDWRAIPGVMEPQARAIPANVLAGDWRCRQLKLGRMSSYIVYDDWFTCSIRPYRGGLLLEKTGGSQRFAGWLYPERGAWVYLGASNVRDEPRHTYSGASPALGAATTPDDQIGLLTGIGNNHLRLEIPAVQESLLDVVEFAR